MFQKRTMADQIFKLNLDPDLNLFLISEGKPTGSRHFGTHHSDSDYDYVFNTSRNEDSVSFDGSMESVMKRILETTMTPIFARFNMSFFLFPDNVFTLITKTCAYNGEILGHVYNDSNFFVLSINPNIDGSNGTPPIQMLCFTDQLAYDAMLLVTDYIKTAVDNRFLGEHNYKDVFSAIHLLLVNTSNGLSPLTETDITKTIQFLVDLDEKVNTND